MDSRLREIIESWRERANSVGDDPFLKMFILYMCFDAWMTARSRKNKDCEKKKWLKEGGSHIKQLWNIERPQDVTKAAEDLKAHGAVKDERPEPGDGAEIKDIENFSEVVECIYQVRCNLFHGGKDSMNEEDRNLCRYSAIILDYWTEIIVEHE